MRPISIRALAALVFLASLAAAACSGAAQLVAVPDGGSLITPAWTPAGLSREDVIVVAELAGDPVALRQAKAGRKLSEAEKERIKSELGPTHDAVQAAIEGLGGIVLAHYKSAYNGIRLRIARDRLDLLRSLPGVVAVRPLRPVKASNVHGIPLIGAPTVWGALDFHGEGVKIAMIDSGIDYTHANFGGPGTVAAYAAAHANEAQPADPSLFGPAAPRVKGGIDLVGDSYNADPTSPGYQPVPYPDPNPLDCNGHGSHVAGTAAGSGVTAAGATYTGTYDATTVSGNSWTIGPGVAPRADIYAVRVFGCQGSSDVVVDAIEWAVENNMDVINMSLGAPLGSKDDPLAAASTNAAMAGIVVVVAAGNEGQNPYVVSSPATADGAIAVAANDPNKSFPAANIALANGTTVTALNANGYSFAGPVTYTVKVIVDDPATLQDESLGCSVADFGGPLPANTIAVVNRGVCARVAKAIYGQQAGAAAVVMVNNAPGLPPFEGPITSNPDNGMPFDVTIPFLGASGPATDPMSDGAMVRDASGVSAAVSPTAIANPDFLAFASFSSAGPRNGDSFLKPDLTAPGVSITSTLSGSGNQAVTYSGTSMATPHVAGSAVLTWQAHPTWPVADIKAAMVNTGNPSAVADYGISLGGTGLVQPAEATVSQVVARANGAELSVALNYGYQELAQDFSQVETITLKNNGSAGATFLVAEAMPSGSPHSLSFDPSVVTVPAQGEAGVDVMLAVPVATVGDANGAGLSFHEVAGLVEFTPASASDNAGVTLRVPYYFVPRASSNVTTRLGPLPNKGANPSTYATVANVGGAIPGNADFYAWGIATGGDDSRRGNYRVRAIGTQSFPYDATTQALVFAVNTFDRWSSPGAVEFDIYVDVDGDGVDDYVIVGADQGAVQTGTFNGQMGAFVFSTRSPGATMNFLANAPTDRSIAELPVLSSQLCRTGEPCLSAANPRITYHAYSFDNVNGTAIMVPGSAAYNVWSSAISNGAFVTVAPGAVDTSTPVSVNSSEWVNTPARGLMIVTLDNPSGASEAQLVELLVKTKH